MAERSSRRSREGKQMGTGKRYIKLEIEIE
jgi:hypothetical protein